MIRAVSLLLFVPLLAQTSEHRYLAKAIKCHPSEEGIISEAYDSFLMLIMNRELPERGLRFPVSSVKKKESGVLITRSFYITPNNLRGFEIFVPNHLVEERDGVVVSTVPLVIESEDSRQGHILLSLNQKPNQSPQTTSRTRRL